MYYPQHVIEQIREVSDIVGIISEYTTLTKKGSSYTGLCPFHQEKTPSFSVSEEKQLYYCFGCGAGGNTITFLMQKENMTFVEAIKYLAERYHIPLEEYVTKEEQTKYRYKQKLLEVTKEAGRFFYRMLQTSGQEKVLTYLEERGLTKETIYQFGIGYAPEYYTSLYDYLKTKGYADEMILASGVCTKSKKSGKLYDRFAGRVMFPIFDVQKRVIAFGGRVLDNTLPKYMNSPENLLFDKSHTLYGMHLARNTNSSYFILVEGYMDVIAMHQAGFSQTVASLGTAFTSGHARLLKRYTKEVVVLYDSDNAGIKAAKRAIPILKTAGLKVRVLQLPEGKDPDDYIRLHGKESMQQLLNVAPSDIRFQILSAKQKYNLEDASQKVSYLQEVASILAKVENSIEQAVYMEEVSKEYHLEKEALKREMLNQQGLRKIHLEKKPINKVVHFKALQPEITFLNVLYHYPKVLETAKRYITPTMFETPLLQELATVIFEEKVIKDTKMIQHFMGTYQEVEDQTIISHVFMPQDERYKDYTILQKMITENIKRLFKSYMEKELKTTTDLQKVQALLQRKKELDKLYIDFISG